MRQIIRTARLFDGTGSAPAAAEIVLDGERITAVHRGAGTVAREDDTILDLGGGTLLPGLIAPGRFADFVLVAGDPLADITILQDLATIALVLKGGRIVADRRVA